MNYTTVSKPVNVQIEIEDLKTTCIYGYQGKSVIDCENYFLELFDSERPYAIIYVNVI